MEKEEKYDPGMYFTALAKGDTKALECIYDTYKEALVVFLRRYLLDDPWMIEEIISELLLILWKKREIIGEIREPAKWMFGIGEKKALQYLQKKRLNIIVSLDDLNLVSKLYNADDRIIEDELERSLRDAIARLPAQERLVWILKTEELLSNEDIAYRLKISRQTVKNELSRAKKKLLESFGYMIIGLVIEILKSY